MVYRLKPPWPRRVGKRADPSAPACVATLVRVSACRPRGAGRAGAPVRPARASGRSSGAAAGRGAVRA
eukprot:1807111-Prymnesium_polylepis.1